MKICNNYTYDLGDENSQSIYNVTHAQKEISRNIHFQTPCFQLLLVA